MKIKINLKTFCENVNLNKKKFNILFFGSDNISLSTLSNLHQDLLKENGIINKISVITTPIENKKSVQANFHNFLSTNNINNYLLINKDLKNSWDNIQTKIKENYYNIGIIASFGKMVPGKIIRSLNNQVYVMHPSLLPKYRGATPIQHSLLNNDKSTGITILEASIGRYDAGSIILKKEIAIEPYYRFKELSTILANEGGEKVLDFLYNYDALILSKQLQDDKEATPAPLIDNSNYVYLDFVNQTSDDIYRKYKAFYGSQLAPFTKLKIKNEPRKIFFENLCLITQNNPAFNFLKDYQIPGSIYWDTKYNINNIFIRSKTDWFVTTRVKLDTTDFLNSDYVIRRIFMNDKFKDKKIKSLNFFTIPKE